MEENDAQMNQEALNLMYEGHEQQAKEVFQQCLHQIENRKDTGFPGSSRSTPWYTRTNQVRFFAHETFCDQLLARHIVLL